jgi:hypothetical protein
MKEDPKNQKLTEARLLPQRSGGARKTTAMNKHSSVGRFVCHKRTQRSARTPERKTRHAHQRLVSPMRRFINSSGFPCLFPPPPPPPLPPPPLANHARHPTSNTPVATCGVRINAGASSREFRNPSLETPAGHHHHHTCRFRFRCKAMGLKPKPGGAVKRCDLLCCVLSTVCNGNRRLTALCIYNPALAPSPPPRHGDDDERLGR